MTRAKSSQVVGKTVQSTVPVVKVTRKRAALGDVSNHVPATAVGQNATNGKAVGVSKSSIALRQKASNVPVKAESQVLVEKRKPTSVASTTSRLSKQESVVEEPPAKQRKTLPSSPELALPIDTLNTLRSASPPVVIEPVQDWDDLDADDIQDPLMVSEYVVEIFEYLREQELLTLPTPDYMERQKELHWKMRGILVDWLVEVHQKFRLLPETLFLAVNIIDRFLSLRVCSLPKLQLVGITALFIASKYEEVMCPSIQNFIYMADGGYTDDEILKAEQYVLQVLEFNLSSPNPMNFLRRVSKADQYDIQVRTVAKYLLEISLVDHRFLVYPPSLVAAAGMYLARYMLDRGDWDANLVHYSGYTESQLIGCVRLMIDYLTKPVRHEAFYKKYASKKFIKASLYVTQWVNKEDNIAQFDDIVDTGDYLVEDDVDY
ncbi:Cyclin B [Taphrina deformans PYCC 5710]|uniref:Cyclin B n=1 Tax=Taphrina deformans (strain PYCC 5710 / ATCC 11124 / CBS 356.35 / IMI 108563 / JCM 9778 / NBRC 8474) TaxID=1097556 RepID=R4XJV1_TAPDE|nr:Cyclin B [Taphrina deformans PYCC 5710]|eukprot:CCG83623.1 Cyclin B [Taphrina deformans PYCC 5710]